MLEKMMTYCLEQNIFIFEKTLYRQTSGIAMGTCFAPSLVNFFLGWWEEQVVWAATNYHYTKHIPIWIRYIDDLFLIWMVRRNWLLNSSISWVSII